MKKIKHIVRRKSIPNIKLGSLTAWNDVYVIEPIVGTIIFNVTGGTVTSGHYKWGSPTTGRWNLITSNIYDNHILPLFLEASVDEYGPMVDFDENITNDKKSTSVNFAYSVNCNVITLTNTTTSNLLKNTDGINFTVSWGDGETDTLPVNQSTNYTYNTNGDKTIKVTLDAPWVKENVVKTFAVDCVDNPTEPPTPVPTATPTQTSTPTPTVTPSPTMTPTPTITPTPTVSPTPTLTPTPSGTPTPTPTTTPTPTPTTTPTPTPTETSTPTPTPTETPTPTPTETPTPTPTETPTPTPTIDCDFNIDFVEFTQPPVTEPPVTEPPVTEPPVADTKCYTDSIVTTYQQGCSGQYFNTVETHTLKLKNNDGSPYIVPSNITFTYTYNYYEKQDTEEISEVRTYDLIISAGDSQGTAIFYPIQYLNCNNSSLCNGTCYSTTNNITISNVSESMDICCADCPEGNDWTPLSEGICSSKITTTVTPPVSSFTAYGRTFNRYSQNGSIVYKNGWSIGGTGSVERVLLNSNVWRNSLSTNVNGPWNGPLNRTGLWAYPENNNETDYPLNVWLGFTYCMKDILPGQYYVGIAADNDFRLEIDGVPILNSEQGGLPNLRKFESWHIYPITLTAGDHIIGLYGYNENRTGTNPAAFGCEIYNNTLDDLIFADNVNDLDIIFTSADFINQQIPIVKDYDGNYTTSGYTCSVGYEYAPCDNNCWKIITCPE